MNNLNQTLFTLGLSFAYQIPFIIINGVIARRKGKEPVLYVLLSFIPFASAIVTVFLLGITDVRVKEQLLAIKQKREQESTNVT